MAFRFKPSESVKKGVRRIAQEQVSRALAALQGARKERSDAAVGTTAVHETRKAMKRLRALVRLVREGIEPKVFRKVNDQAREVASVLAGRRDADVILATLKATAPSLPEALATRLLSKVPAASANGAHPNTGRAAINSAIKSLGELEADFRVIAPSPNEVELLIDGFEAGYRRARRAMAEALELGTDEGFHDWRKYVQRHWRQLALLGLTAPDRHEVRIETARALSTELGRDHDLSIFMAAAANGQLGKLPARDLAVLKATVRRLQHESRERAIKIGEGLFKPKPRQLREAVEKGWKHRPARSDGPPRKEPAPHSRARAA